MKHPGIWRTLVYPGFGAGLAVVLAASGSPAVERSYAALSPAAPPGPPSAVASQEPTTPTQPPVTTEPASGPAAASEPIARLYMPDGQLKSHALRIYVTRDIQPDQGPRLRLLRSHAVTEKAVGEADSLEPGVVAPGQQWTESVGGQQVLRSGTLMLFDISKMDFGARAMVRVRPVVSWREGGSGRITVGANEVNVGSIVATVGWTVLVLGLALLVVIVLSRRGGGNALQFLTGVDGHLSLAQTQIACWTVAIGGVVLGYGFINLEIPHIPESLLALMGASLATGGIGFFQDTRHQEAAVKAGATPDQHLASLGDLVRAFSTGEAPELSLAKAQMLFWTALLLVLFVSKSILDGAIWEVPWALVALMGFSQAGYLAPKLASQAGKAGGSPGDAAATDTAGERAPPPA